MVGMRDAAEHLIMGGGLLAGAGAGLTMAAAIGGGQLWLAAVLAMAAGAAGLSFGCFIVDTLRGWRR